MTTVFYKGFQLKINVDVTKANITAFNKVPNSYLTDAEGNYIYDLVAVGAYTRRRAGFVRCLLRGRCAGTFKRGMGS